METNNQRKLRSLRAVAADIAYALTDSRPGKTRRANVDMVRHAMARAVGGPELKSYGDGGIKMFDQDEAFYWAVRKWPACQGKLAYSVTVGLRGQCAVFKGGSVRPSTLVGIPGNIDELRQKYVEAESSFQMALYDLGECRKQLLVMTQDRDRLQSIVDATHQVRVKSGGTRGKWEE